MTIQAGPGAIAFGAVVVLTMFAAEGFDPAPDLGPRGGTEWPIDRTSRMPRIFPRPWPCPSGASRRSWSGSCRIVAVLIGGWLGGARRSWSAGRSSPSPSRPARAWRRARRRSSTRTSRSASCRASCSADDRKRRRRHAPSSPSRPTSSSGTTRASGWCGRASPAAACPASARCSPAATSAWTSARSRGDAARVRRPGDAAGRHGDVPGRQFVLRADDLGSLDVGSPVYFRRVQVGQVVSFGPRQGRQGRRPSDLRQGPLRPVRDGEHALLERQRHRRLPRHQRRAASTRSRWCRSWSAASPSRRRRARRCRRAPADERRLHALRRPHVGAEEPGLHRRGLRVRLPRVGARPERRRAGRVPRHRGRRGHGDLRELRPRHQELHITGRGAHLSRSACAHIRQGGVLPRDMVADPRQRVRLLVEQGLARAAAHEQPADRSSATSRSTCSPAPPRSRSTSTASRSRCRRSAAACRSCRPRSTASQPRSRSCRSSRSAPTRARRCSRSTAR